MLDLDGNEVIVDSNDFPIPKPTLSSFETKQRAFRNYHPPKTRLIKEKDMSISSIPEICKDKISQLVTDNVLKRIVSVIKIGKNTVVLHAKLPSKKYKFYYRETDDVVVKIFTKNNHTKPDMKKAQQYRAYEWTGMWNLHNGQYNSCQLVFFTIDNVVVMRMIGKKPKVPQTLPEMLKENPNHKTKSFRELLQVIGTIRNCSKTFWSSSNESMNDIFWIDGKWTILDHGFDPQHRKGRPAPFYDRVISLMRFFELQGMSKNRLKTNFNRYFKDREDWQLELYRYVMKKYFEDPSFIEDS